jgi:SARP family transcriptional regulator, regulator of embCAB operon
MIMPIVWVLGSLQLGRTPGGGPVLPRRKQRQLLALLLARPGEPVSGAEIVDHLWGARPPSSARANLYTYVSGLRRTLQAVLPGAGAGPESTRYGYRLTLPPDGSDAAMFERLAAQARVHLAQGRPGQAVHDFDQALALWRGPVLEGLDQYGRIVPFAARLNEARADMLEDLVQTRMLLGQYAGLAADLIDATARYPLRERLWGQLMTTLYRTGRRAEALHAFASLSELLNTELGVGPGPEVSRLHHLIRAGR